MNVRGDILPRYNSSPLPKISFTEHKFNWSTVWKIKPVLLSDIWLRRGDLSPLWGTLNVSVIEYPKCYVLFVERYKNLGLQTQLYEFCKLNLNNRWTRWIWIKLAIK